MKRKEEMDGREQEKGREKYNIEYRIYRINTTYNCIKYII